MIEEIAYMGNATKKYSQTSTIKKKTKKTHLCCMLCLHPSPTQTIFHKLIRKGHCESTRILNALAKQCLVNKTTNVLVFQVLLAQKQLCSLGHAQFL